MDDVQKMITRRKTLSLIAGAAAAGTLASYGLFSTQSQTPKQTRDIREVLAEAGRVNPPDHYVEFMEWLAEVSKNIETGKEPTVALMAESAALAVQRIDGEFFHVSGIASKLDVSPYPVHVSKTLSSLTVGASIYDAVAVESFDVNLFINYFTPVQDFMEKYREYTYEKFRLDDFIPESLNLVGVYPPKLDSGGEKGNVVMLPFSTPTMITFYRRDIYEKNGHEPPATWEEYLEDLKTLNNPSEGFFGTAQQVGSDVGIVTEFNNLVHSFGGRLFEVSDGKIFPVMDSDAVVEALRTYSSIRPYADPASISYDWDAVATAMRRGRIVHAILWQDYAWMMDDPVRSVVVNKVGYKPNPAGPAGSFHQFVGDGVGLVRNGKNPVAMWLWLQWATEVGTRIMLMLDEKARVVPIRKSVLMDRNVQSNLENPKFSSVRVVKEILEMKQVASIPPLPRANQVFFIMGRYLRSGWSGADPRQTLREMKNEIESLGSLSY
ncbi:MAG: extracellular solute-binding protein [Candidatus Caldarchaeum sp.]